MTIYEGPKRFYFVKDNKLEEIDSFINALLEEDEYELIDTVEIDYSKEKIVLVEDYEEGENIYSLEEECDEDNFVMKCKLIKVKLPGNEEIKILQPTYENLDWECDDVNGLPIYYWAYDENGKREATDEEIDLIW